MIIVIGIYPHFQIIHNYITNLYRFITDSSFTTCTWIDKLMQIILDQNSIDKPSDF